ncbi:hypothetical protein ACMGE5_10205 [Macrococcus equi]|uniref:hypothetical protein n=1 Tax=Macrococcus equi TaxID=3395462 RepID=UPI0039BE4DD6
MDYKDEVVKLINDYCWKDKLLKEDKDYYYNDSIINSNGKLALLPTDLIKDDKSITVEENNRIKRVERLNRYGNEVLFINYCLEQLDDLEREVLERLIKGDSVNKVGSMLGIKRRTVVNSYNKIIELCEQLYKEKYL